MHRNCKTLSLTTRVSQFSRWCFFCFVASLSTNILCKQNCHCCSAATELWKFCFSVNDSCCYSYTYSLATMPLLQDDFYIFCIFFCCNATLSMPCGKRTADTTKHSFLFLLTVLCCHSYTISLVMMGWLLTEEEERWLCWY